MLALGARHSCSGRLSGSFPPWLYKSALRVLRIILVLLQLFFIWRVFLLVLSDSRCWLLLFRRLFFVFSCCFSLRVPFVEPQQLLILSGISVLGSEL